MIIKQNKRIFYSFVATELGIVNFDMIDGKIFSEFGAKFFGNIAHPVKRKG